jgi:sterol carrier protein 2
VWFLNDFLDARPHLKGQALLIAGQCPATNDTSLYDKSSIDIMGFGMAKYAALKTFQLSPEGSTHETVHKGDITYGGKMVIDPSGGLISKGHSLGKTGLAQCAELVWHLRGWLTTGWCRTLSLLYNTTSDFAVQSL